MRFVPTKDVAQQDIQALHRVRERLMGERTALVKDVHGLLHEYGMVMPKGVAKFRQAVDDKLEAEKDKLTPLSQEMFWKLVEEFAALEEQLAYYQEKLEALATAHPKCQRLMTIPGIWAPQCDGPGGRGQRCQRVQKRPVVCRLAGAGAAPTFDGREGAPVGHQQTGR
jgi:transposase